MTVAVRPRVSVIMRTKNSASTVGAALTALFSQEFDDFELLVVDSGSTDDTLSLVDAFPCRRYRIPPSHYVPGPVLNDAVDRCQGEIVVFQNSDVVPVNEVALGSLLNAFDDPKVQAAFARQLPRPEAHTCVRSDYARAFPDSREAPPWLPFSLPFAAMRRSAWEQQPFYSGAWGSEDTEWGVRARQRGWRIRYVADALVMHSHNYTLRQLYGRRFIEGEADAFIYGERLAGWQVLVAIGRFIARDAIDHVRRRDAMGLSAILPRRTVYHWAHYRGHCLGRERIEKDSPDVTLGQRIVLGRQ